ncbi:hypothetical protein JMJ77_0004271 [Colletotrichum scovillei]|uniref:Uncharacterized protein n=1 Tax=Colletotrichum scovillei TaxID=1209932 RepID=A0A9P7R120_9PEZI|nr:hypothetical protein JMJ77_0004271 [Colletotrichum scovillei]KAG7049527.1 hypothetical protein JMJ78_0013508 [Colletotrichum scovillei]KAG7064264.1 hypothetical protein JMJ76_0007310 [Colletotrichum scovillei]
MMGHVFFSSAHQASAGFLLAYWPNHQPPGKYFRGNMGSKNSYFLWPEERMRARRSSRPGPWRQRPRQRRRRCS